MAKLSEEQRAELEAMGKLSDDDIDLSDIPKRPIDWSKAKVGMFYKPDWTGTWWTGSRNTSRHPGNPTRT